MPAPMTEKQERFAAEYAMNGGDHVAAAEAAGYSAASAADIGRNTLALPHVECAILKTLMKLRSRSGAIGLNAMIRIATNEKAPAAARVSAARSLMEHAGLVGTAKELIEARADVSSNVVDYLAVLEALGRLPKKPTPSDAPQEGAVA